MNDICNYSMGLPKKNSRMMLQKGADNRTGST